MGETYNFDVQFEVESYLRHQGQAFINRFDANSYLYITRAMDYFDLAEEHGGKLSDVFALNSARFCIIAFSSDWLFPPVENKRIAHALNAVAAQVSFVEIKSDKGHDAFLLDEPEMFATVRGFLNHARAGSGMSTPALRPDLAAIAAMIRPGARVLDVGCGDGALLEHLKTKNVDGRGIEISQANVNACVARGLAVVQGDADTDLVDYPAQVFDAVILSQTIQATEKPRAVLEHLLRIGQRTVAHGDFIAQFRLLESARLAALWRADAAHPHAGLFLVGDAQYPSVHPGRFRGPDARMRRHHGRGPCPERQRHHKADDSRKPHPWLSGPQPVRPGRRVPAEEELRSDRQPGADAPQPRRACRRDHSKSLPPP